MITHRYKQETRIPWEADSIVGGIQPEALRQALAGERHFDDGLVARFLLTWRPPLGRSQRSDETIKQHGELMEVFAMLEQLPAPLSKDGNYEPPSTVGRRILRLLSRQAFFAAKHHGPNWS